MLGCAADVGYLSVHSVGNSGRGLFVQARFGGGVAEAGGFTGDDPSCSEVFDGARGASLLGTGGIAGADHAGEDGLEIEDEVGEAGFSVWMAAPEVLSLSAALGVIFLPIFATKIDAADADIVNNSP